MCLSATKGLACTKHICTHGDGEVWLSGEGSAGGEELRLEAVRMCSPAWRGIQFTVYFLQ